jgi:hypothetical protein
MQRYRRAGVDTMNRAAATLDVRSNLGWETAAAT